VLFARIPCEGTLSVVFGGEAFAASAVEPVADPPRSKLFGMIPASVPL
jgi:hypothetical protein